MSTRSCPNSSVEFILLIPMKRSLVSNVLFKVALLNCQTEQALNPQNMKKVSSKLTNSTRNAKKSFHSHILTTLSGMLSIVVQAKKEFATAISRWAQVPFPNTAGSQSVVVLTGRITNVHKINTKTPTLKSNA